MQNRYPFNQWQEIIGNCDVQLFLGCTDEITAKFISDRTGEVTIGVSSKAKQLNTWRVSNYTPEYRETSSIGKRKLLTMDEVLRLPINKALVIIRGHKVLKVDKYDYTLHPDAKKLKPSKASAYVPEWYANVNDAETEFSPFDKPANPAQNKKLPTQDKKQKKQKSKIPTPPPVADDKSNNDEKLEKAPESPVSYKEMLPVIPDTENSSDAPSEKSENSDEPTIVKSNKNLIMSKKT
jgi:type IV secretion system protein VirD4